MDELTEFKNRNEALVSYVNSMADMEIRSFTLKETAAKCQNTADTILRNAQSKKNEAQNACNACKSQRSEIKTTLDDYSTYKKYRKKTKTSSRVFAEGFAFYCIYLGLTTLICCLIGMIGALVFKITEPTAAQIALLVCGGAIIALIIYFSGFKAIRGGQYKKIINTLKTELDHAERQIEVAENNLDTANNFFELEKNKADHFIIQANELIASAAKIDNNLKQCYSLNIIPPAYRNLVCVALIDYIFSNYKADTMREAVLLCDAELRHRELVNALSNIYHAFLVLSENIMAFGNTLQDINDNISSIHNDISNISRNQEHISFAVDSIKQSADNVDIYVNQQRFDKF